MSNPTDQKQPDQKPARQEAPIAPDNRVARVNFRDPQSFGNALDQRAWDATARGFGYTATITQLGVRFSNRDTGDEFTVPVSACTRIVHPNAKEK